MSWPAPDVAMKAYTERLRCTLISHVATATSSVEGMKAIM